MSLELGFEDFCRAYFLHHCRQGEGLTWEGLNDDGRDLWRSKARRMWRLFDMAKTGSAA
jgi:hypothetical protein